MRPDAAVMVVVTPRLTLVPIRQLSPLMSGNNGSPANAASAATPIRRTGGLSDWSLSIQEFPVSTDGPRRTPSERQQPRRRIGKCLASDASRCQRPWGRTVGALDLDKPLTTEEITKAKAISDSLVKRHHLPRIPVESRELKLAKDDNHSHPIDSITYLDLDINGRRERIFGYVIKDLHYDLILGIGWAEGNHVVYKAGKRLLRIGNGSTRINVREAGWMNRPAVHEPPNTSATQLSSLRGCSRPSRSARIVVRK
ncbi:uncharacterized protein CPUR_05394 [Claviceps purpurea 20.1]|uniref:Uncharacterized protein n=1 Tax=Claviceps purpurea (strain 20.1) TaxID=1111077 RepID=M1W841_CLAP2|nr:uncharacterized protein CPUR_05394 [Claviceps purpurea 20.1]